MMGLRAPDYLTERFLKFARTETHGSSPLYALLAERAAGDPDLQGLAAKALPGQHEPLMLLAAVHFLLLSGVEDPLAEYYPTCTPAPRNPDAAAFERFQSFCRLHHEALVEVVSTRRAQTNEVNRCTGLLPAFGWIAGRIAGRPVDLIELGTSAGLNLNWDRYGYDFGRGLQLSPIHDPGPDLELVLKTELRGPLDPPAGGAAGLNVAGRRGIDLHPIDLSVPGNPLWLQALVWPEHLDRMRRLEKAMRIARRHKPPIRPGDAGLDLPELVTAASADRVIVLFHSFVVYQMDDDRRDRLFRTIRDLSAAREIYRVSLEWIGTETPLLEVDAFQDGRHEHSVLAAADPHGRWLEWLDGG